MVSHSGKLLKVWSEQINARPGPLPLKLHITKNSSHQKLESPSAHLKRGLCVITIANPAWEIFVADVYAGKLQKRKSE